MWAIVNARVRDGVGGGSDSGGIVVNDDGRIVAVGPDVSPPAGARVVDAHGFWLLPAFIDAHAHLGVTTSGQAAEAQDGNEPTEAVTPDVRALDGINPRDPAIFEALEAGVTAAFVTMGSANVIGGIGCTIRCVGSTVEEMVLVPAAGMKAALGENPKRVHGQGQKRRPASRPGIAAVLREWLERARRYADDPPAKAREWDPKLEALAMVVRGDVPLRVHCHRADDIMTAHRIAAEFGLKWVIDHGTEAHLIVDHVARWGVAAVIGPTMGTRGKAELREKTFRTPGILAQAGVPVAICSDHPVTASEYLRIFAGLAMAEGMPEEAALAALTSVPADIVGVGNRLGRLAPGYEADMVLWDADPLRALQARVRQVFVAGQPVFER